MIFTKLWVKKRKYTFCYYFVKLLWQIIIVTVYKIDSMYEWLLWCQFTKLFLCNLIVKVLTDIERLIAIIRTYTFCARTELVQKESNDEFKKVVKLCQTIVYNCSHKKAVFTVLSRGQNLLLKETVALDRLHTASYGQTKKISHENNSSNSHCYISLQRETRKTLRFFWPGIISAESFILLSPKERF